MKALKISLKAILLFGTILFLNFEINAQFVRITYPIDRMIFQQKFGENTPISLSFQIDMLRFTQETALSGGVPIYKVEKVDLKTGTTVLSTPRNWAFLSSFSNWSLPTLDFKGYLVNDLALEKGWYRVTAGVYYSDPAANFIAPLTSIVFGVGDVYFVAGQSNASGFDEEGFDNVQNYSQTYPSTEQYECISFIRTPILISGTPIPFPYGETNIKGLPFNPKPNPNVTADIELLKLINADSTKTKIYPNGRGSWYWSQFAYRMAKDKETPTMIFNAATPNTSTRDWATNFNTDLYKQFRRTLQTYGNILGTKAVLWFQGEKDTQGYHYAKRPHTPQNNINLPNYDPDGTTYLSNFKAFLSNLLAFSRGDLNPNLNWYLSKLSYTNAGAVSPNGSMPYDPSVDDLNCGSNNPPLTGVYKKMKSDDIKAQQSSLWGGNNIAGVATSDNIDECD